MLQDGLEKVLEGLTTFDEIYKIIDIDDEMDDEDGIYLAKAIAYHQFENEPTAKASSTPPPPQENKDTKQNEEKNNNTQLEEAKIENEEIIPSEEKEEII